MTTDKLALDIPANVGGAAYATKINAGLQAIDDNAEFSVLAKGADPTGASDDTTAFQAAIDECQLAGGGVVSVPTGTYNLASPGLVIESDAVTLRGRGSRHGTVYGEAIQGSTIVVDPGAYDAISTSGNIKGLGVEGLGFDGWTDPSHSVMKFGSVSTGLRLRDISIRQYASGGMNAINLDGGGTGIYYARLDNIFVASGGGHLGGTGVKFGDAFEVNACTGTGVSVLGYATGIDFNLGGGNIIAGVDLEFCTVGARFNSSQCVLSGGWIEQDGTAFVFTANSVNCLVQGTRGAGLVTTLYTDAGTGNRLQDVDGNTTAMRINDATMVKGSGDPALHIVKGDIGLDEGILRFAGGDVETTATAGGGQAVPATVAGYLEIMVDGNLKRVPYFNA